jgi:hypothetical protein
LPAHWRTLYELTLLTYKQFAEGIKSGRLFLVTAFRCRRLGLHFGRGDRHPARAVNGGINNPLRVITRASKPCSVCIVAH